MEPYLIALGSKDHLPVGEPLRAEHLVHAAQVDSRLAEHVVGEHVTRRVRGLHRPRLEANTKGSLSGPFINYVT